MQYVVFFQILWALGSIFWNLSGLQMMEDGGNTPVPSPSWISIIFLLILGILIMIFNARRIKLVYRLTSIGAAIFSFIFLYDAFSADPELWLGDAWQWSGVFINVAGLVASMAGVFGRFHRPEYRPDPISPFFREDTSEQQ